MTDKSHSTSPTPQISRSAAADSSPIKDSSLETTADDFKASSEKQEAKVALGTKRGHEEDHEDYTATSNIHSGNQTSSAHEYKRSAYDVGVSKPHYIGESQRQSSGLHELTPVYTAPYISRQTQEDYSVPNHMVGLLIGKGGENLKKIERTSGVTKVQFDNDPFGTERVVHIIGEPDQIAIARDMLRQMVSDAQIHDSSRFPSQTGNTANQTSINFRIPSNKVGLVIGRGGETLRDFQERSKAKIMIASDSYGDRNHERVITLVGDEAATQQAKTMIEELIFGSSNPPVQNYPNNIYDPNNYNTAYRYYGYGSAPRADDDNVLLPVPSYAVGLIIGRGGETIKSIQEQSGARVKVNPTNDPSPEQRIVNITGDPNCVAIAKRLVEEKVHEANRTAKHPGYVPQSNEHYYGTEYNQYNQYYTQHSPQYYPGNTTSYQQYSSHPYFYQGGHNSGVPPNPSNPQAVQNPLAKGENQQQDISAADYYYGRQFYDPSAYHQWYQYYNSQSNGGYPNTQSKQETEDKNAVSKENGKHKNDSVKAVAKQEESRQDQDKEESQKSPRQKPTKQDEIQSVVSAV